ncbi:glycosyltransferase family 2 protein [Brucella pituitosa]|uniref:glycosyltransferase family 2 protein n=1 Tax=Brucella pituitosa TaxID=571256 RepID=UPI003F4A9E77
MINLSIIVPTYNSNHRIGETISSITRSLTSSFELIIVDDCSTDSTRDEVSQIASLDKRIKTVFMPENGGAGLARNAGLKIASGEFVLFLDDDDTLIEGTVDNVIEQLECYNLDVAVTSYALTRGNIDNLINPMIDGDSYRFANILGQKKNKIIRPSFYPLILSIANYPWNKICRASYLRKIKFTFPSLRLHEDILPHWNILLNAPHVFITEEKICHYRLPVVGKNASHRKDALRLQIFDALVETNNLVFSDSTSNAAKSEYLDFCCEVLTWARSVISVDNKVSFDKRLYDFWSGIGFVEINKLIYTKPHTAKRIFETLTKGTI